METIIIVLNSLNLKRVVVSSPDTLKTPVGEGSSDLFSIRADGTFFDETGNERHLVRGVQYGQVSWNGF